MAFPAIVGLHSTSNTTTITNSEFSLNRTLTILTNVNANRQKIRSPPPSPLKIIINYHQPIEVRVERFNYRIRERALDGAAIIPGHRPRTPVKVKTKIK